jgi:hypothetical protein
MEKIVDISNPDTYDGADLVSDIAAKAEAHVSRRLTGKPIDYSEMVDMAMMLDEAIDNLVIDDDDPRADQEERGVSAIVYIAAVAAVLRRCDVEGTIIARV